MWWTTEHASHLEVLFEPKPISCWKQSISQECFSSLKALVSTCTTSVDICHTLRLWSSNTVHSKNCTVMIVHLVRAFTVRFDNWESLSCRVIFLSYIAFTLYTEHCYKQRARSWGFLSQNKVMWWSVFHKVILVHHRMCALNQAMNTKMKYTI